MVGSACFALASIPAITSVLPQLMVAITFFVGSIFFTSAALLQLRRRGPLRIEWWASIVQVIGTVLFNVNTFDAMFSLSPQGEDLVVWGPDAIGSACFLIASLLAFVEMRRSLRAKGERVGHGKLRDDDWWVAVLNLLGSAGFGLSALAAFVVPDTGTVANAAAVTTWTFAGAICFFLGAYLLLPEARARRARRRKMILAEL